MIHFNQQVDNIYTTFEEFNRSPGSSSSVGSSRLPSNQSQSQGVQTETDSRVASAIRKLHDMESLSGILDFEDDHPDPIDYPDVISDTMSVKSGYSLKTF